MRLQSAPGSRRQMAKASSFVLLSAQAGDTWAGAAPAGTTVAASPLGAAGGANSFRSTFCWMPAYSAARSSAPNSGVTAEGVKTEKPTWVAPDGMVTWNCGGHTLPPG